MKPNKKILLGFTGLLLYQVFKASFYPPSKSVGRAKMNVTKFFPVYKQLPERGKNGKTNLAFTRNKSGVYIIKENNKIVYIGMSSTNLYRTITRHFYNWIETSKEDGFRYERTNYFNRLKKHKYTIRVVLTSPARAKRFEADLINKYKPRDKYSEPGPRDNTRLETVTFEREKDAEELFDTYKSAVKYDPDDIPF